jgi:hypothetical protein
MPGRSGVTAPIRPDNRTTGTTAIPRRSRAGSHAMHLSSRLVWIRTGPSLRSFNFSVIQLPRINHFLPAQCHVFERNATCMPFVAKLRRAAEKVMKIYLLMLLIGTILTAIRFTSAPKQQSKTLPQ